MERQNLVTAIVWAVDLDLAILSRSNDTWKLSTNKKAQLHICDSVSPLRFHVLTHGWTHLTSQLRSDISAPKVKTPPLDTSKNHICSWCILTVSLPDLNVIQVALSQKLSS